PPSWEMHLQRDDVGRGRFGRFRAERFNACIGPAVANCKLATTAGTAIACTGYRIIRSRDDPEPVGVKATSAGYPAGGIGRISPDDHKSKRTHTYHMGGIVKSSAMVGGSVCRPSYILRRMPEAPTSRGVQRSSRSPELMRTHAAPISISTSRKLRPLRFVSETGASGCWMFRWQPWHWLFCSR